jgi:hypothetical protein
MRRVRFPRSAYHPRAGRSPPSISQCLHNRLQIFGASRISHSQNIATAKTFLDQKDSAIFAASSTRAHQYDAEKVVGCMLRRKSAHISEPLMSDETEPHDLTGSGIVALFKQSADLAEGNSRYALEIAQKLSLRLVASENRVAELELRLAELEESVKAYRDRAEQAEGWLQKISSELQQRVAGKPH